jgi:hypothetical protein
VRDVCNILAERIGIQASPNPGSFNESLNVTLKLINGVTLDLYLITSYEIVPADTPAKIDSHGRLVNADITITYLEVVK